MASAIPAHPDALYYLHAQGLIALAVGIALGLLGMATASRRKIKTSDVPWLVMTAAGSAFLLFEALWSFTQPIDTLTVEAGSVRMGGTSVALGDDVHVSMTGREPAKPEASDRGFDRLPGASRVPPFFTGGPMITVKSSGNSISFKPALYGPSGYFLENANPATDAFYAQLVTHADADAKSWLTWMAMPQSGTPSGPKSTHSWSTFLMIYTPLTLVVVGLLAGVNVLLLLDRRKRAPIGVA